MVNDCKVVIFSDKAYNAIICETFEWDPLETGGILLGHILDNGFWIVMEVLPPGYCEGGENDDVHHEIAYFEYNQRFVNYLANSVANQYEIPLELLGLWHRHPGSKDYFSSIDDETNKKFASQNPNGAISGLINVDPKLRMTMYYFMHDSTEKERPSYQSIDIKVGSDLIPEKYFVMRYYRGDIENLHPQSPYQDSVKRRNELIDKLQKIGKTKHIKYSSRTKEDKEDEELSIVKVEHTFQSSSQTEKDDILAVRRAELKEYLLNGGKITLGKSNSDSNEDNVHIPIEIPEGKLAPQPSYYIDEDASLAAKRAELRRKLLDRGKFVVKPRREAIDKNEINGIVIPRGKRARDEYPNTYTPYINYFGEGTTLSNLLWRLFKRNRNKNVYSSIFTPAEVKPMSHMLVQVYLHLYEETEKVKSLAQESDKDAERRDYIPLLCKLKKGDKVDVLLNIYGEALVMSDKKTVVWHGSFTKCSFDYFVPKDINVDELSCVALLSVNGVPVGEMRFITSIVEEPRKLNPKIIAHKYNKVFISYSHQDESKVKFLHEGLELGAVPHFFDRKYLKAGDVFPQVIQDYINSADLFILCWSENASKSEYVKKERLQVLERAFPQVQPEKAAKLRIYPMSIEPRAELPSDMKEYYHFGEI